MKEFNGTVVIVDPEKFAKSEDLGKRIDVNLGKISPKLGFRNLLLTETGIGCCYLTNHKVDDVREYFRTGVETYVKDKISRAWSGYINPRSGRVSIDSGTVGAFLLEDIENYNPGALKKLRLGGEYVIFDNFKGKIGYLRDKYGMIHFYGTGTANFYTL